MNGVSVARMIALALAVLSGTGGGLAGARGQCRCPAEGVVRARMGLALSAARAAQRLRRRWRRPDAPCSDRRRDAKARLDYWTKALAESSIRSRSTSFRPTKRSTPRYTRQSIETMANDIKYKIYEAPFNADTFFWVGAQSVQRWLSRPRRPIVTIIARYARHSALLRRADRQLCGADLRAGSACRRSRPVAVTRRSSPICPPTRPPCSMTRSRKCPRRSRPPSRPGAPAPRARR